MKNPALGRRSSVTVTSILVHVCEPCRRGQVGACEANLCEHWKDNVELRRLRRLVEKSRV